MLLEVATGCGDDSADAEATPARTDVVEEILAEQRAEAAGDAPDHEHTLVIGVRKLPGGFDPLGGLDPWARRIADDLLFEGLTRRSADEAPFATPALADRCIAEPSDAPRDVYCHLRPGTTFHDGSAVTTDDVLFSLEYWLDPRRAGLRARHGLTELRKVEAVDRPRRVDAQRDPGRWIRVGFAREEPLALELIAQMKIVPKAARRAKARSFAADPIGTGPMRLTAIEEEQIVFDRVAPSGAQSESDDAVQRLIIRAVPDGAMRLTQLRRGDLHIVGALAPSHVPVELAKPGMAPRFEAYLLTPPQYDVLVYNLRSGVQSGPRLRGALDTALPREALAELGGLADTESATIVDLRDPTPIDLQALADAGVSAKLGMAGLPAPPVRDDEAAAAAAALELDALGWPLTRGLRRRSTTSLRVALMWDGAKGKPSTIASTVRDAWRGLGVVVPYATASWNYVFGLMRKGAFDVGLMHVAQRSDADLFGLLHSRGEHNISGVADAQLDAALERYRAAEDRAQRQAAKVAIAERLVALKPMSVLRSSARVMVVSRRVRGLEFIDDLPRLDALHLGPQRGWISGG